MTPLYLTIGAIAVWIAMRLTIVKLAKIKGKTPIKHKTPTLYAIAAALITVLTLNRTII